VAGSDSRGGAEALEPAHRPQPGLQPTMIVKGASSAMSDWMRVASASRPLAGRSQRVEDEQGAGRLGAARRVCGWRARQRFEFASLLSRRRSGSVSAKRSCGVAVFVDEPAEAVDSVDLPDAAGSGRRSVRR
jgi:hypothetical protein